MASPLESLPKDTASPGPSPAQIMFSILLSGDLTHILFGSSLDTRVSPMTCGFLDSPINALHQKDA
jgi:hypothetical protein